MEGNRRVRAFGAGAVAITLAASGIAAGCGGSSQAVEASDPAEAFAPRVALAGDERRPPVSARWFLNRSALWFAQGRKCPDSKIAVGRRLGKQRTAKVDWLYMTGIGTGRNYAGKPYQDARCEIEFGMPRIEAVTLNRPFETGARPGGAGLRQGFYLDLMDWARGGPHDGAGPAGDATAPAYVERREAQVDGEPGMAISYWLLYTMNEPPGRPEVTHEGDWERVDVLLKFAGEDDYVPVVLRIHGDGGARELPWEDLTRVSSGGDEEPTHPVLLSRRGSHELRPAGNAGGCAGCVEWKTWRTLVEAGREPWYGFGGAWGDLGESSATTGPLGPRFDDSASGP